jgi:hypothetical protein
VEALPRIVDWQLGDAAPLELAIGFYAGTFMPLLVALPAGRSALSG